MTRRTLTEFLDDVTSNPQTARAEFLIYDDGYRTWSWSYADLVRAAGQFADRIRDAGITSGEHVAIWSENRPEWIAALWGALLEGVVVVPIDYRASPEFLLRVAAIVDARAILTGDVVDAAALGTDRPVWPIHEIGRATAADIDAGGPAIAPDTTA